MRDRPVIVPLLLAFLLLASSVAGAPAAAAQVECAAQQASLAQVHQQIAAHNAKPHVFVVPRQAGEAAAYNAEAAALEGAQAAAVAALQACRAKVQQRAQALKDLADTRPGSPAIPTPKADTLQKIDDARGKYAPNYVSPIRGPDASGNWRVPVGSPPRPLYDVLRRVSPPKDPGAGVTYQGQARPVVGDRNPAGHPRNKITGPPGKPQVSPDHIIPLTEIIHMPGFLQLNARNMYSVVNAPLNLQWMASATNMSKNSRSAGRVFKFDPAWRASQEALEKQIRPQLQAIINRLLASQ